MGAESLIQFMCYGRGLAPISWQFNNYPYVNRLYYIYGGNAYFTGGPHPHPLNPGCLYLFPYHLEFAAEHDPKDCLNHLYFDFSVIPPMLLNTFIEYEVQPDTLLFHLLQSLACIIVDSPSSKDPDMVALLFQGLFTTLCREANILRLHDERINQVLEIIHERFGESLTNEYLAQSVHLDQRHFLRLFKHTLGITLNKYVREYRMNIATKLLRNGFPLQEVAEQVGYDNVLTLSKAFKKSRGISPNAYLASIQAKPSSR